MRIGRVHTGNIQAVVLGILASSTFGCSSATLPYQTVALTQANFRLHDGVGSQVLETIY